jgi:hypothetical protein
MCRQLGWECFLMARPKSDLNLRRIDAGTPPKRSRRDRKKPEPPHNLKAGKSAARAFADTLPLNPGVITEGRGKGVNASWQVQSPHADEELWTLQLVQAFGTRSRALIGTFLEQLGNLCPEAWDERAGSWKIDETEWNALLSLVADHQPENSAQAALAAQMAATHMMVMRLSAQALNRGHTIYHGDAALASKLARTFAIQCDTMQMLKGKSRTANQSIHVHKETHQHVHHHGGGGENGGRPHDPTRSGRTIEAGEAVWSEEPGGQSLPSPSREGQGAVPISWSKGGRAER